MLPMYLGFLGVLPDGHPYAPLIAPYIAAVAILMVSRVPTYSGKNLGRHVARDMVLPILGLGVFGAVLLISFPWQSLTVIAFLYLGLIPFSIRSYRRHALADSASPSA
jgi:CDP-diacylglycerol--serine O-phosphatidyltransferase